MSSERVEGDKKEIEKKETVPLVKSAETLQKGKSEVSLKAEEKQAEAKVAEPQKIAEKSNTKDPL